MRVKVVNQINEMYIGQTLSNERIRRCDDFSWISGLSVL